VNAYNEALVGSRLVSLTLNAEERINERRRQRRQLRMRQIRTAYHQRKRVVVCRQTYQLSSFPHNAHLHLHQNTDFCKHYSLSLYHIMHTQCIYMLCIRTVLYMAASVPSTSSIHSTQYWHISRASISQDYWGET